MVNARDWQRHKVKNSQTCLSTGQLLAASAYMLLVGSVYAGVAVIVNPASTLASATADEIKALYLNKANKIGGQIVKPVDHVYGDVRKKFLRAVVGRKPREFKAHWTRLTFSGKASPIKIAGDDADVKRWVANHRGSIGFIHSDSVDATVKVIYKIE